MQISLILMEEIAKLFLIMFMGYALVKTKLLRVQDSKVVSVILVYLVIPCMIVHAFQIDDSPQVRTSLLFAFAAAAAVHVLFLLFTAILRKPCRLSTIEQLTVIYTNAGILVVPLIQALLGQQYVVYSCGFLVVQLVLIWTHCRSKLTADNGIQWKKILWNINVISIFIGAVLFLCHITLPSVIDDTIQMTGDMVGPMGMLLAGMVIADIPLKQVFTAWGNYKTVLLRLLVYPLLLLVLFRVMHVTGMVADGKNILLTVFLACITPACATVTSMAQLYDKDAAKSSVLYVLTTICSIVTMPIMIGLYCAWL